MRALRASAAWLVLAPLLLAGCVDTQDLGLVCERGSRSPWHPYAPEELAQWTRLGPDVTEAEREDVLRLVADRLVTPGGRAYDSFDAHLARSDGEGWAFEAAGAWPGGEDVYRVRVERGADGPRIDDDRAIEAPAWLRSVAVPIAERSAEAREMLGPETEFVGAVWDPALAACVDVTYACVPSAETPCAKQDAGSDAPAPAPRLAHVWVNVDTGSVVAVRSGPAT